MKKTGFFVIALAAIMAAGCGNSRHYSQEGAEVAEFTQKFVRHVSANEIDSVKDSYPAITEAYGFAPLSEKDIEVEETAPGRFLVKIGSNVTLDVVRASDGVITVEESRGLFEFPEERIGLARKTGMVGENATDKAISDRLKDTGFYEWLRDMVNAQVSNGITITPGKVKRIPLKTEDKKKGSPNGFEGTMECTLLNTTDHPISENDYYISYLGRYEMEGDAPNEFVLGKQNGVYLAPGSEEKVTLSSPWCSDFDNIKVVFNINMDKYLEEDYRPTGSEYKRYLAVKDSIANDTVPKPKKKSRK